MIERHPLTDPAEIEAALEKCLHRGYTTAKRFALITGWKYDTAKDYLDGLCKGDNPRLRRYKEGTTYHYVTVSK